MPRYDYRCSACGQVYEKREGFSALSVQECPTCRGEARRVLTPPAIVFKGSGWYVNDSRKTSPAGTDRKSAGGEGETPAAAATTETKTEAPAKSASETTTSAAAD